MAEHDALQARLAREEAQRERIRAEEAARLEREAAAKAAAEKAEADRLEKEAEADRARSVRVEADRIAREQAEAVSAAHIREEQAEISRQGADALAYAVAAKPVITIDGPFTKDEPAPVWNDNGPRLTLTQINERLSPLSVTGDALAHFGFEPVERVKASKLYRACDLPAICAAISKHALAAAQMEAA